MVKCLKCKLIAIWHTKHPTLGEYDLCEIHNTVHNSILTEEELEEWLTSNSEYSGNAKITGYAP